MSKKKKKKKAEKLNQGHYIEAIDRAYIIADMIESVLVEHPVIEKHKELRKRVKKAQDLILETYQLIGGIDMELFPVEPEKQ